MASLPLVASACCWARALRSVVRIASSAAIRGCRRGCGGNSPAPAEDTRGVESGQSSGMRGAAWACSGSKSTPRERALTAWDAGPRMSARPRGSLAGREHKAAETMAVARQQEGSQNSIVSSSASNSR